MVNESIVIKDKYISVRKLAEGLNMGRADAYRYLKKHGIKTLKQRTRDSGNKLCIAVTKLQVEQLMEIRKKEGLPGSNKSGVEGPGFFYVIQLIPELDPHRIKLGFALDINEKLNQHLASAPTAIVLKSWPCKPSWEAAVMDFLTVDGCKFILNEVFECNDIDKLIQKGDQIFKILPDPNLRVKISEKSPLQV